MKCSQKTILILGGSGLLGSNLVFHLSTDPNLRVLWLSRGSAGRSRISYHSSDSLRRALDTLEPDVLVNCVGIVGHGLVEANPAEAEEINVFFAERLAQLTHERGLGLVHFSSDAVYSGNPEEAPFSEKSSTSPFSLYGRQKLESESRVMLANPFATVMRINFFGWSLSGNKGMLDHFVSHGVAGTKPIGYSLYFASSLYAGGLSRVVAAAIAEGASGVFNVGSRDSVSKLRFGRTVFTRMGHDPRRVISGDPSAWASTGVRSRDLSMSSELVESTLGISLDTQLEGIGRAFDELGPYLNFWKITNSDLRHRLVGGVAR